MQEAFFYLARHFSAIDTADDRRVQRYLVLVARSRALDQLRRTGPEIPAPEPDTGADLAPVPEDAVVALLTILIFAGALAANADVRGAVYTTLDLDRGQATLGILSRVDGGTDYILFWESGGVHHTLEGDLPLDELVRVANGIKTKS